MKWHYSSLSSFNLQELIPPLCQNPKMTFKLTCRLSNYKSKLYHILLSGLPKLQRQRLNIQETIHNCFCRLLFSIFLSSITVFDTVFSFVRRRSLTALGSLWSPSKELACLISGADLSLLCSVQQSWSTQTYRRPLD